ncbi:hypothetical protein Tco_0597318 [Tanacetum coccineum]
MKRPIKGYSGQEVALFPTMIDVTAPSTSPSRITSSPSHSPEHSPSPTPSPSPEPTPAHTTAEIWLQNFLTGLVHWRMTEEGTNKTPIVLHIQTYNSWVKELEGQGVKIGKATRQA